LYISLKTEKMYSRRKLVLLAILLGAGKAKLAADTLEEQYRLDEDCVDAVALAADMGELAISILPIYAELELKRAQDTASLLKLTNYIQKLKLGRTDAVRQLRNAILGEESCIRLGDLRGRLKETGDFMVSRALRKKAMQRPLHQPGRLHSILKTPLSGSLTPSTSRHSVRFLLSSTETTE
jgi:hypothetical protein